MTYEIDQNNEYDSIAEERESIINELNEFTGRLAADENILHGRRDWRKRTKIILEEEFPTLDSLIDVDQIGRCSVKGQHYLGYYVKLTDGSIFVPRCNLD